MSSASCSDTRVLGRLSLALEAGSASSQEAGAPSSTGGSAYRGTIIFQEPFQDAAFASRGWYDTPTGTISGESGPGFGSSFECVFTGAGAACENGRPGRVLFPETEAVYLSYWIKYSPNHHHSEIPVFVTNKDVADTPTMQAHLAATLGFDEGAFLITLNDNENIDTNCLIFTNGTFSGCNGDVATYAFTEARSVNACNGVEGNPTTATCVPNGSAHTGYESGRTWRSAAVLGRDAGPSNQNDWHFIELFYALNRIQGGTGIADGEMRLWVDQAAVMAVQGIRLRTGQYPDLRFNQLDITPWCFPVANPDEMLWMGDLTLAEGVRN